MYRDCGNRKLSEAAAVAAESRPLRAPSGGTRAVLPPALPCSLPDVIAFYARNPQKARARFKLQRQLSKEVQ